MAELQTQSIATVTLTELEKKEIALQVAQSISDGNVAVNLSNTDKADIASQIASEWAQNGITVNISDQDKADIVQEVLAELYAKSQQTRTLEKVNSLDGITTIPACEMTMTSLQCRSVCLPLPFPNRFNPRKTSPFLKPRVNLSPLKYTSRRKKTINYVMDWQ